MLPVQLVGDHQHPQLAPLMLAAGVDMIELHRQRGHAYPSSRGSQANPWPADRGDLAAMLRVSEPGRSTCWRSGALCGGAAWASALKTRLRRPAGAPACANESVPAARLLVRQRNEPCHAARISLGEV